MGLANIPFISYTYSVRGTDPLQNYKRGIKKMNIENYKISAIDFELIIKHLERLSDRLYLSDNDEVIEASFKVDKIIDELNDSIIKGE